MGRTGSGLGGFWLGGAAPGERSGTGVGVQVPGLLRVWEGMPGSRRKRSISERGDAWLPEGKCGSRGMGFRIPEEGVPGELCGDPWPPQPHGPRVGAAPPNPRAVRSPERAAPGQEAAEEEEGEGAGPERAHPAAARSPAAPGARA